MESQPVGRTLHECIRCESTMLGRLRYLPVVMATAEQVGAAHSRGTVVGNLSEATITVMPSHEVRIDGLDRAREPGADGFQSDIWGLGAILAFVLGGYGQPIDGAPPELVSIARCAMRTMPGHRYGNAAEVALDLRRYQKHLPVLAHRRSLGGRAWSLITVNGAIPTLVIAAAIIYAAHHEGWFHRLWYLLTD